MSTNPNNAVGTNAAYGGRTSVNAFNDGLAAYSRGIISGWDCAPSSGLTVTLGGNGSTRDVAVAEDNAGNKTSIDNISGSPISVTLSAAPGANSRIDVVVAYVDNPPQGSSNIADNYESCGIISVQGIAAANPVAPNDSAIRTAITADGASGTTAYYVVLAQITIASGTTDITADDIVGGFGMASTQLLSFADSSSLTTTWSTTGGTSQRALRTTAPASGTYVAIANGGLYADNATYANIYLAVNGTIDSNTRQLLTWANTNERLSAGISYSFTVNAGDHIDLFADANTLDNTVSLRAGFTLSIIRIN